LIKICLLEYSRLIAVGGDTNNQHGKKGQAAGDEKGDIVYF